MGNGVMNLISPCGGPVSVAILSFIFCTKIEDETGDGQTAIC